MEEEDKQVQNSNFANLIFSKNKSCFLKLVGTHGMSGTLECVLH